MLSFRTFLIFQAVTSQASPSQIQSSFPLPKQSYSEENEIKVGQVARMGKDENCIKGVSREIQKNEGTILKLI
jgi:hypothetical protein